MEKNYRAVLYYGTYNDWENGEVYHSFWLDDPEDLDDEHDVENVLAYWLDCKPDDEHFSFKSMDVQIPPTLINRIRQDVSVPCPPLIDICAMIRDECEERRLPPSVADDAVVEIVNSDSLLEALDQVVNEAIWRATRDGR